MNRRLLNKLILPAALVLGALAVVVALAALSNNAEARSAPDSTILMRSDGVSAQQADADSSRTKPYIGIMIASAGDGETDAADAGVLVVKVIEGSPADGSLQPNDVITALDAQAVETPRDVVNIVRASQPGDTIVFSITRDGAPQDVSITVGEHERSETRRSKRFGHAFGRFGADSNLVLSETRYQIDDGTKTVRKAVGTLQSIDADSGRFTMLLRDGSETLEFTAGDETEVASETAADLAGLNTTDTTLVVEHTAADGTISVDLVAQGEFPTMMHSLTDGHGFGKHMFNRGMWRFHNRHSGDSDGDHGDHRQRRGGEDSA